MHRKCLKAPFAAAAITFFSTVTVLPVVGQE
jgi:hypothetical protein